MSDSTMPDIASRICPVCKNPLTGKRKDAIYCSKECKLAAYLARNGIRNKREHKYDICQRDGCGESIPENSRSDTKYCSNACRQKVYADKPNVKKRAANKHLRKVEKIKRREAEKEKAQVVEEFIQELMS